MTTETLLRHDGNSVALGTPDIGEYVVPDGGLVLLLQTDEMR